MTNTSPTETVEESSGIQAFGHKYRWTGEEIGTIIGLGVLATGVSVWGFFGDWFIAGLITGAAFLLIAAYAFNLGRKRKRKSALTAEFNPKTDRISVGGHEYEASRNHMAVGEVKSVGYKHISDGTSNRFSPRDLLLFQSNKESRNLKVPVRLLSDEDFYALVSPIIAQKGSAEAQEAAEFGRTYGG